MFCLRSGVNLRARGLTVCKRHIGAPPVRQPIASTVEEYTEEAQYPEIKDLSLKTRRRDEAETWHEAIRQVPTVEEKLIKINMPRYYGHKVVHMSNEKLPYNVLPAMQHYTRTLFEELPSADGQKSTTSNEQKDEEALLQSIKGDVQDAIEFSNIMFRQQHPDDSSLTAMERDHKLGQLIVEQVHRVLYNALMEQFTHLRELEIDYNPRHEAFWSVGGIDPPKNVVKSKEGRNWQKDMARDPVDRFIQYAGTPYLALRHRHQLPLWKSAEEYENLEQAKQVPRFNFDPRTLGYSTTGNVHGTNIPGFWPGSSAGFGFLSYQPRDHLTLRPASYGEEDFQQVLHAQAMLSSYAWLLALANYNGFNTFNELTYPMNTQTIITNGRKWSFYEYQLNTLLIHGRNVDENPKVNFCRGTHEMQLYDEISAEGKCIGFNEEVVKQLLKCYKNEPTVQRSTVELQPYLGDERKLIADYDNEEQRVFLENTFKHLTSNRPRHLALPEIYLWEKIYKIDNNTRAMEPRRRFFELDINPWRRTLDQHQKEYIPRCKRILGPKDKKNKFKKTYYP